MSLDIKTINGVLRVAAEEADKKGTKAYNGNLDEEEISAFIKNGRDAGCSMSDILDVATKVVPKDSHIIKQAQAEDKQKTSNNNEIARLKEQIATLEKELKQKEKDKESMWQSKKWQFQKPTIGTITHGILGFGSGAMLGMGGYAITGMLLGKMGARKLASSKGLFATMVSACAIAGAAFVIESGAQTQDGAVSRIIEKKYNIPENYKDSVRYNKAEKFAEEQIVPLRQQILNLKNELAAKESELK